MGRQRGIKGQIKKGRNYLTVDNLDNERQNQEGGQAARKPNPGDAARAARRRRNEQVKKGVF